MSPRDTVPGDVFTDLPRRIGEHVSWFRRSLLACAMACCARAHAQTWGPWYAIGPYEHAKPGETLEPAHAPERALKLMLAGGPGPDLAEEVRAKGAPNQRWTVVPVRAGDEHALDVGPIDLVATLARPGAGAGWSDSQCAYLYRRVDCDADTDLAVAIGSDDGLRLWLDGDVVIDFTLPRATIVQDHQLVLHLKRGANHLLAKVVNVGGPWAFQLTPWKRIEQKAVDAAIDRGLKYLRDTQLLDGSWGVREEWGAGAPAFALYTLLKCGVSADDPSVRMALAACEARPVEFTYSAACCVLALAALHDERQVPRMRELVVDLRSWQSGEGLLGYPVYPNGDRPPVDLSNTLYAALAYRAAEQAGIDLPDKDWLELAQGALRCLCRESAPANATNKSAARAAGFSYRASTNEATGSMTTAGLSVLALAQEGLQGKLPGPLALRVKNAVGLGMNWLDQNVQWAQNPGQNAHHYFWIYGVERAGTLLGFENLGGVDWYWSGAAYLIKKQKDTGAWSDYGETEEPIDTLLALLFLKRATVPVTGDPLVGRAVRKAPSTGPQTTSNERAAGGASDELSIHARGNDPTIVWVSGLRAELRDTLAGPKGLDVVALELWGHATGNVKDESDVLLGSLPGRMIAPDDLATLELAQTFPHSGAWVVRARLRVRVIGAPERTLESPPLALSVQAGFDQRRLDLARRRALNLIQVDDVKAEASTNATRAREACDGSYLSGWRCNAKDRAPWLRLTLDRPLMAARLSLAHAGPRLLDAAKPRAQEIEVVLNGSTRLKLTLEPDVLLKSELDLPPRTAIRTLEIKVLSARDGTLGDAELGFSEIELSDGR